MDAVMAVLKVLPVVETKAQHLAVRMDLQLVVLKAALSVVWMAGWWVSPMADLRAAQ